jgi:hypothetical protein
MSSVAVSEFFSASNSVRERIMLKYYVWATETAKNLRHDAKGVVSFEYVIVAACVVVAVGVAFGTTGATGIGKALSDALAVIVSKLPA